MSRYGTGMRNCCDSPLRGNRPHIVGCENYIPQDSQTITADYVQVRREDIETLEYVTKALAERGEYKPLSFNFSDLHNRLRAALNQGQG